MKTSTPLHFTSTIFAALLLLLLIIIILPISGCSNKNDTKETKPEVTLQNLQTAYGREMRIGREYSLFAMKAEKGYSAVAALYRAAARTQQIHAEMAAALLRSKGEEPKPFVPDSISVGTVMQTLHLATSDEGLETESMFPNLARTAELEKFPEAGTSFRLALSADKRHAQLFKDALDNRGNIAKTLYFVCPCCGYIVTSDKVSECPECHEKKEKFEKIS